MGKKYIFSEEEKARVAESVKELEKASCGEIVPYFVSASDDYPEVSWYSAVMLAGGTSVLIGIMSYFWLLPFTISPLDYSVLILVLIAVGYALPAFIPSIKRWLIPGTRKEQRVLQRATEAFMNENVFQTEERVGILIFVSQLEHRVMVLGDEGINNKVSASDWESIVYTIVLGIKDNRIGDGLSKAIGQCKELLLQHGFVRKSSDYNELDDDLRIGD